MNVAVYEPEQACVSGRHMKDRGCGYHRMAALLLTQAHVSEHEIHHQRQPLLAGPSA